MWCECAVCYVSVFVWLCVCVFAWLMFSPREYVPWRLLGRGRTVEFTLKAFQSSSSENLEKEVAADLQASLLLWGRVAELVYMQGCWPPKLLPATVARDEYKWYGLRGETCPLRRLSRQKNLKKTLLAPTLPSDTAVNLGTAQPKVAGGWRRHGNHHTAGARLWPRSSRVGGDGAAP